MHARTLFRNAVGRAFSVGQYAIAHDQPLPGSFPCRVALIGTRSPGTGSTPLAQVDLFLPSASRPLTVYVDADNLFPSFAAIADRQRFPSWFAARLFSQFQGTEQRQQSPLWFATGFASAFRNGAAAFAVAEAFAVRCYFHHERYETLDRWFGAVDQFVDDNTFHEHERADLDQLRGDLHRERVATLRRIETATHNGPAPC